MLDIYSACESGSVTEVRSVMRRLTNSFQPNLAFRVGFGFRVMGLGSGFGV